MTTKLEHSSAAPKTYWAILNRLIYNKKIPAIVPYCYTNFFVSICTLIENNSVLPPLLYKTNTRINSLDSSKSHGCDNISIKMIKICSESVTIPLKIISEGSLKKEYFQKYVKKLM